MLGEQSKSSGPQRVAVAIWMNALIMPVAIGTVAVVHVFPNDGFPVGDVWAVGALKLFALRCIAFVPGWLYVHFLRLKAGVLWSPLPGYSIANAKATPNT
jgi:hypothetical protein